MHKLPTGSDNFLRFESLLHFWRLGFSLTEVTRQQNLSSLPHYDKLWGKIQWRDTKTSSDNWEILNGLEPSEHMASIEVLIGPEKCPLPAPTEVFAAVGTRPYTTHSAIAHKDGPNILPAVHPQVSLLSPFNWKATYQERKQIFQNVFAK